MEQRLWREGREARDSYAASPMDKVSVHEGIMTDEMKDGLSSGLADLQLSDTGPSPLAER